jgi:hypothetical protein
MEAESRMVVIPRLKGLKVGELFIKRCKISVRKNRLNRSVVYRGD